jgi:8-oxo-dGTP pyrophosphatase MutT (NUDIX family)
MGVGSTEKSTRPSRQPEKRREVAAVCYRIRKGDVEFLLVQTRSGRWTFPKGGVEADLTQAQSAALEAVEEAGVHGRIEEVPFARYFRKHQNHVPARSMRANITPPELAVAAHLCEVFRQEPPQERDRNPTWLNADKTKQRLRKNRTPEFGAELVRVVERAQSRIERLRHGQDIPSRTNTNKDGLQEVRFEARTFAVHALPSRVLRISPDAIQRPVLRLGTGVDSASEIITKTIPRVTPIDTKGIDTRQKTKSKFPVRQ